MCKEGGHEPPSLLFVSGVGRPLKKFLLALVMLVAASPASAAGHSATPAPYAGTCGLADTQPIWFDFGQPYLQAILGQPGIAIGTSTGTWPAQMRSLGAATVYFDLNLKNRVGTTTKPTDTSTMPQRAQTLFTFASQQTGCSTPVIVFNELAGPGLVTPWSDTNAQ